MSWHLYAAFGERKTVHAWAQDPRCRVSRMVLRRRLSEGWAVEEALTTPAKGPQRYTAFGETMTVREWAQDSRCRVPLRALWDRLSEGWALEEALTTPLLRRGGTPRTVYTAWGEAKSLPDWARDPRCRVSRGVLELRVANGMPLDKALTTPADRRTRTIEPTYTAQRWDQTKTLTAWLNDPRARVSGRTLRLRLAKQWPLEKALTTPPSRPGGRAPARHTAHGETKSLRDWARDPRCKVSEATLRKRVTGGMPLEQALRQRERAAPPTPSQHRLPRRTQLVTGEERRHGAER